jgi:hypothetical protein
MTVVTITRTPDIAKALNTKSGKELEDILSFLVTELTDQVIRCLRNGISFQDNVTCKVSVVELTHDVYQEIDTGTRTPTQILFGRVSSPTTILTGFGWYIDERGRLQVKVKYDPVPSPTAPLDVTLTILF